MSANRIPKLSVAEGRIGCMGISKKKSTDHELISSLRSHGNDNNHDELTFGPSFFEGLRIGIPEINERVQSSGCRH